MVAGFESINSTVLRDQVSNAILQAISNGELRPGDQVNEAEIARLAGISRGPVREAIQQLVGEEILINYPQRGTFVVDWTEQDILEVYSVRSLLESFAVSLAVKSMDSKEFTELAMIVDQMMKAAHDRNATKVFELDLKFHLRSYEFSRNKLLCQILDKLRRKIYLYVKMDADTTPDLLNYAENHQRLLEVMRSGDPDHTEKVFREHILSIGQTMAERFRDQRAKELSHDTVNVK